MGLTRVGLYWDFLGGTGSPALEEQVRGYVAYVWPDPKSTRLEEGRGLRFVLPSVIQGEIYLIRTTATPMSIYTTRWMSFRSGGWTVPLPGD